MGYESVMKFIFIFCLGINMYKLFFIHQNKAV